MKRTNQIPLLIGGLFLLISCSKEEIPVPNDGVSLAARANFFKEENKLTTLTKAIANSATDAEFVKRVHQSVQKSVELGLDESFYLKEIKMKDELKKITKGIDSKIIYNTIAKNIKPDHHNNNVITKKASTTTPYDVTVAPAVLESLIAEDENIYWPNADLWNGSETPVILYIDENNINDDNVLALKPIKDELNRTISYDTIIVNEAYSEQHPIWIVGDNQELKYDELPQLADGERINDGTLYLPLPEPNITILPSLTFGQIDGAPPKNYGVSPTTTTPTPTIPSVDNNIYNVKLGRFMASKQWDPWLKGGSEFYISFTETAVNSPITGTAIDVGATAQINRIFVDRPRKTINRQEWVEVNDNAVSHWRKEVFKSAMIIIEKDLQIGGGDKKIPYDIPFTVGDKTYNLKGEFEISSKDDLVTTKVYDRSYIFSTLNFANNQWTIHSAEGVNWTLPYTIGTSIYN